MRLTVINKETGDETSYRLRPGQAALGLAQQTASADHSEQQRLRWEASRGQRRLRQFLHWLRIRRAQASEPPLYPLLIDYNGLNVTVTDRGGGAPIYLADQLLPTQKAWTWPPEQELLYGNFILLWEETPDSKGLLRRTPLERISPLLAIALLLLIVLGLVYVWRGNLDARKAIIETSIAGLASPLTVTVTITGTLTPTPTITPTPTFTSTATAMPARVSRLGAAGIAVTFTPTPTNTLAPAQATQAAARKICTDTTPQALDKVLVALEVQVKPACVKVDEFYWRLIKAEWQDEAASNGMHHVFVYLLDEAGNPVQDERITMRWESGECTREVKDASGANCAMFNAGFAYRVQANGLPSEQVINLGLGTVELRTWAIRTSFVLTFQKTRRR